MGLSKGRTWFDSSLNDQSSTEQHWRGIFRMGQDTFRDNENVVPPTLEKRDAHFQGVIPIEKQVVIALWRLATGKSFCSTVAKAFCLPRQFFLRFFLLNCALFKPYSGWAFLGLLTERPPL